MKNRFSMLVVMISMILGIGGFLSLEAEGKESHRIYGDNRFETAVEISKEHWETSRKVVLTQGGNFPDALAGATLAYKQQAPILLTRKSSLPPETKKEIQRLQAEEVIILGGPMAVSNEIEKELINSTGVSVTRISGENRMETAESIADRLGKYEKAILVNGSNFPDALSIAPIAAEAGYPILLTRNGKRVTKGTENKLNKAEEVFVIGGPSVVSEELRRQFSGTRISGSNRYETAAEVIKEFHQDNGNIFIATGTDFADALTGSAAAAKQKGVTLLSAQDSFPSASRKVLHETPKVHTTFLGGPNALSESVLNDVQSFPSYQTREQGGDTVIYYSPHPDDEILTMGVGIANDLYYGRDVHIILLTQGRASGTYQRVLADHPSLTPQEFGQSRVMEFIDAMERLGLPESNYEIYDFKDGQLQVDEVKEVVRKYEERYPGAYHKTFSYYDPHRDHVAAGIAVNELYIDKEIEKAEFHVSSYQFQNVSGVNLPVYDRERVIDAAHAYMYLSPREGRYSVGYSSVPHWFDRLIKRPQGKVHGPNQ
ncbi:cell wall-binding repeat-containing protein [Bacillus sp. FJAT-44742]|uniref:cell wall-binding repeat-containing protein n=1 Tax=Bacillus sp. FJAT-44742 TaxID=2014005 RepID=UPI000C245242|nr:cell wall-binding repeat-containing protein [Bacillus sp. FJAT-44742]